MTQGNGVYSSCLYVLVSLCLFVVTLKARECLGHLVNHLKKNRLPIAWFYWSFLRGVLGKGLQMSQGRRCLETPSSLKYQTHRTLPRDVCLRSRSSDIHFWNWASRVTRPRRGQMYARQESLPVGIVPHRAQTNPKGVKRINVLTCSSWKDISSSITNRGVAALHFEDL